MLPARLAELATLGVASSWTGPSDATDDGALVAFGEGGVVELVGVVGYVAMLLNVARTPPGTSDVPLLPPLAAWQHPSARRATCSHSVPMRGLPRAQAAIG